MKIYVTEIGLAPTRAHETDAALDLRIAEDALLYPGEYGIYSTGVHVAIPEGQHGKVVMRSSMSKRGVMLMNGFGVIDSGYRGEIKLALINVDRYMTAELKKYDRVAQLIIEKHESPDLEYVLTKDALGESERGDGGFGSTGIK